MGFANLFCMRAKDRLAPVVPAKNVPLKKTHLPAAPVKKTPLNKRRVPVAPTRAVNISKKSLPVTSINPEQFIERINTFCDEAVLTDYALQKGYGFKTANLKQLETLSNILRPLISELRRNKFNEHIPYKISVPEFVGVSSDQILDYLVSKHTYYLNVRWNSLVSYFRIYTWIYSGDKRIGYKSEIDWDTINAFLVDKGFYPKLFALGGRQEKVPGDQYGQYKVTDGIYDKFETSNPESYLENLDEVFGIESAHQSLNRLIIMAQGFQYDPQGEDFKARWKKESGELGNFVRLGSPRNLIIRSTGREDTKETANAGGNESVLNVNPADPRAIWEAIAIVVASYFNEKSFMQRLNAHDKQIFDEAFVPVLFQIMICEEKSQTTGGYLGKLQGVVSPEIIRAATNLKGTKIDVKQPRGKLFVDLLKIPSCGVIYTEEQEGGLARSGAKNPDGSEATTKITVINASRGLNEGVVNSKVPVDTYYVGSDYTIHSVIRSKTKRLVPKSDGTKGSDEVENPEPLVNTPALDQNAVFTLKFISDAIEKFYKQPMDVEFVVDNYNGVIYIVQARPFQSIGAGEEPCYLKNVERYEGRINGEILLAGDGAVKLVSSPDQIIIEKDITAALDRYNAEKNSAKKEAIKCIVIGQPAPVTSHEAATFRSYKKPVLIVPEFAKVSSLVDGGQKIAIDLQQAVIVQWMFEEFDAESKESGWVTYPIPALVSLKENAETKKINFTGLVSTISGKNKDPIFVELQRSLIGEITEEHVRQVLRFISESQEITVEEGIASRKAFLPKLQRLLKTLKTSDSPETKKIALMAIGVELISQLNKKIKVYATSLDAQDPDNDLQNQITMLKKYLVVYATKINLLIEVLKGLEDKRGLEARKVKQRFLYVVRCLEAIIYQQPSDKIIAGYSFVTLFKSLQDEPKIIEKLLNKALLKSAYEKEKSGAVLSPDESWALKSVQFARLSDHVTTPELAEKWISFIRNLRTDKRDAFVKMYQSLSDLGILQAWIHTIFYKGIHQNLLLSNFEVQEQYLKDLAEKTKMLDVLDSEEWLEPSKFESQYNKLLAIVDYVVGVKYELSSGVGHFEGDSYQESGAVVTGTLQTKFLDAFSNLATLEFEQNFIDSDPRGLEKISALNFIQSLVNVVDTAIKTLKGSDKYTLDSKLINVRKMLQQSFRILNALATIKVGDKMVIDGFLDPSDLDLSAKKNLYQKLLILRDKFVELDGFCTINKTSLLTSDDFNPEVKHMNNSPEFDVSANAIGSVGDSGYGGDIETLEDAFTFIHQSTLNTVSLMGKYTLFSQVPKPAFLELVISRIEEVKKIPASEKCADRAVDFNRLSLIGVSFIKNSLVYKYNLPLGAHGFSIELKYDVDSKKIQITCNICGPNEAGRFYKVGDFIEAVSRTSGIKVDVKCLNVSVEWKWHLDERTLITYLPWYIFHGLDITMATEGRGRSQSETDVEKIYRKFWGLNGSVYGHESAYITGIVQGDSKLELKLAESIVDISLNGSRSHLALGWAIKHLRTIVERALPEDKCKDAINTVYIKIIKILRRLCNEQNYRLNSDFVSFKRLYTVVIPVRFALGGEYNTIKPNYFETVETVSTTTLSDGSKKAVQDCVNFPMNEILFRLVCDILNFEEINPENIKTETWKNLVDLFELDAKARAFINGLPAANPYPGEDFYNMQNVDAKFLESSKPGALFGWASKFRIIELKTLPGYGSAMPSV